MQAKPPSGWMSGLSSGHPSFWFMDIKRLTTHCGSRHLDNLPVYDGTASP